MNPGIEPRDSKPGFIIDRVNLLHVWAVIFLFDLDTSKL